MTKTFRKSIIGVDNIPRNVPSNKKLVGTGDSEKALWTIGQESFHLAGVVENGHLRPMDKIFTS